MLREQDYVSDRSLAVPVFLAMTLKRPLFLEGEAGVGKTEIARALAQGLNTDLIRLQCYEGLDIGHAVYEWNYTRQMLEIRLMEAEGAVNRDQATDDLFSERFLIKRPLLQAIDDSRDRAPVLLIDELDRAVHFQANETIHTENSYKYDLEEFSQIAYQAGFYQTQTWTDDARLFAVQFFERR